MKLSIQKLLVNFCRRAVLIPVVSQARSDGAKRGWETRRKHKAIIHAAVEQAKDGQQ